MIKKNIFPVLFILISLITVSCEKDAENITGDKAPSVLKQGWVHSYEEEYNEKPYNIYRPIEYKKFPPSRYRQYLFFEDNDVCVYSELAPDDGIYDKKGKWIFNKDNNSFKILDEKNKIIYNYKIIKLTKNILKVKPIY